MKESARTLLLQAIRLGDEHTPPVNPRGHHLSAQLLKDLAESCYEHAVECAADSGTAGWLVYREGFHRWWADLLGPVDALRVLPGLRTDVVKYLEGQDWAKRQQPRDTRLFVRAVRPELA